MGLEEKLCDEIEAVRVIAGCGCEPAMIARKTCRCVRLLECGNLLYRKQFSLMLKEAIFNSYVMPAMLYGSIAWSLKDK